MKHFENILFFFPKTATMSAYKMQSLNAVSLP